MLGLDAAGNFGLPSVKRCFAHEWRIWGWTRRLYWHCCGRFRLALLRFSLFGGAPSAIHRSSPTSSQGCIQAGGATAPPYEPAEVTVGLSPRVNLDQHMNLVTVDFIGGDGAEGSIPCLEDDD